MPRSPTAVFVALASLFGVTFAFVTPPFQVPDEYQHWFRAYQVSEGHAFPRSLDGAVGDALPRGVVHVAHRGPWSAIQAGPEHHIAPSEVLRHLGGTIDPADREFVAFPNASEYSPVPYLPQSVGLWLSRACTTTPGVAFYAARLTNLACWIALVVAAIHLLPAWQWTLVAIALLPMSLFMAASVSADAVTNGSAFVWTALCLRYAVAGVALQRRDVALLALGATCLTAAKPYVFLLGLAAFLPAVDRASRAMTMLAVLAPSIAWLVAWRSITADIVLVAPPGVVPAEQLAGLLAAPQRWISLLVTTLGARWDTYLTQFIGVLGWLDTALPRWSTAIGVATVSAAAIAGGHPDVQLSARHRVGLVVVFLASTALLMTALYLRFTVVGNTMIDGVQGRYFLPIALALLIPLSSRWAPRRLRPTALPTIVGGGSALVLGAATWSLIGRYYG